MKKWLQIVLLGLVIVVALCGALYYATMRELGFFRTPVYETAAPALPALSRPAVLVFSKTAGYIHKEALPAAKILLQQIAGQRGWSLFLTDNGAIHNAADLKQLPAGDLRQIDSHGRRSSDHPIIWKHCLHNGRVFYSALGHTAATYQEANYRSVLEHAIAWAAGLEGDSCKDGKETARPAP